MKTELRFMIDALTPESLSLGRFAVYLAELGKLLGDNPGLHFDRIEHGSAVLVAWADEPAVPKIEDRLTQLRSGSAPLDTVRAQAKLNDLLREDNAVGQLSVGTANVIPFPGRTLPKIEPIGLSQQTAVEGQLIRIGGKDKTVPFHLADQDRVWHGKATRELARLMGSHLFGSTLRVSGTGTWKRNADGEWHLSHFRAVDFDVLDDAPLTEALAKLRALVPEGRVSADWALDLRGDGEIT